MRIAISRTTWQSILAGEIGQPVEMIVADAAKALHLSSDEAELFEAEWLAVQFAWQDWLLSERMDGVERAKIIRRKRNLLEDVYSVGY